MRALVLSALAIFFCASVQAAPQIPAEYLLTQKTEGGTVIVDKRLIRKPTDAHARQFDTWYKKAYADVAIERSYPFDVKLSEDDTRYFAVLCDSDASGDPTCELIDARRAELFPEYKTCKASEPGCRNGRMQNEDELKYPLQLQGQDLTIPGDGCVYSSGNSDDYFDRHQRDCLKEGEAFVHTRQPYYYAGLKGKAKGPIVLYEDEKLTRVQGVIAAGEMVEVVLALPRQLMRHVPTQYYPDGSYAVDTQPTEHDEYFDVPKDWKSTELQNTSTYLLRDNAGIVGWAKVNDSGYQKESDPEKPPLSAIEGLQFNGD